MIKTENLNLMRIRLVISEQLPKTTDLIRWLINALQIGLYQCALNALKGKIGDINVANVK